MDLEHKRRREGALCLDAAETVSRHVQGGIYINLIKSKICNIYKISTSKYYIK